MRRRRRSWAKLVALAGMLVVLTILATRHFATATDQKMAPAPDPVGAVNQAEQCAQCHEMLPEVLTWQASAHSKFACTVCHVNSRVANYTDKHQSGGYNSPIRLINPIPNEVCLRCHSANRVVSPAGDLRIPHQRHLDAGVVCVTCHYGVVHAKIAERDLTAIIPQPADYQAWSPVVAQKVATEYYLKPSMWTCLNCHKKTNVTRTCGACHTTIPSLPSHDQPAWRSEHGKYARNDLQACVKCHATPGLPVFIIPGTGDKAADLARAQVLCYDCHLQRPGMHGTAMAPIHPDLTNERGRENCLTCHDVEQPLPDEKVSKVYCNQCHWFNIQSDIHVTTRKKL